MVAPRTLSGRSFYGTTARNRDLPAQRQAGGYATMRCKLIHYPMTIPELARVLERLGCPPEKCVAMASQLDKRARMDAGRKVISYEAALKNLIALMAQGWAAQAR